MGKVITWVLANGATVLAVLQAILKAIKELVTGVVNLLSLFIPAEAAEASVLALRGIINKVDEFIEKIKTYLLK